MKTKKFKEMFRKSMVTLLVSTMIFSADLGVAFAQEVDSEPVIAAEVEDADTAVTDKDIVEESEPAEGETAVTEPVEVTGPEETDPTEPEDPCAEGHTAYEKVKRCTLTANGAISEYCSVCGVKLSSVTTYHPETFELAEKTFAYTGKYFEPSVIVSSAKGVIDPSNYTVTYENNKVVGIATAKVVFNGVYYKGTKELTFQIKPKATTITSLTASTGASTLNVKWEKVPAQVSGYQIQYAENSKFTSAKTVNVTGNKTFSMALTNLTPGKKYYVRVRTYKKVGSKTYYAVYSKSKSATTYTADELAAIKAAANVIKNGRSLNYTAMNKYIQDESYLPFTTNEKIFYDIFKEENAKSYTYKVASVKTNSASSVTVKVDISFMNYYDAAGWGYLDTVLDVAETGKDSEKYIHTALKKYTLAEANGLVSPYAEQIDYLGFYYEPGEYIPYKDSFTTEIKVIKKNGVWKVKTIPDPLYQSFTCYGERGMYDMMEGLSN